MKPVYSHADMAQPPKTPNPNHRGTEDGAQKAKSRKEMEGSQLPKGLRPSLPLYLERNSFDARFHGSIFMGKKKTSTMAVSGKTQLLWALKMPFVPMIRDHLNGCLFEGKYHLVDKARGLDEGEQPNSYPSLPISNAIQYWNTTKEWADIL